MRLSATVLCFGTLLAGFPAAANQLPDFVSGLSAGTIAAISDGDFEGASYATGRLSPAEAGFRDLLTVISIESGIARIASTPVSNSVTAAPEVLDLGTDGRYAFVVERLGERPDGGTAVRDLPPGNRLFAIDLTDKANPRPAAETEIAAFPEAVAASPDGRHVAVVSNTQDAGYLQLVAFENGTFGAVQRFDLSELGIDRASAGPRGGITATNVHWHPSGRILAVNINTLDRVAFFRLVEEGGSLRLELWGNLVTVGRDPFVGRFTPDGRHYLTSNWGRDFTATDLESRIPDAPSSISVIRLGDPEAPDVEHAIVSQTATDVSAEGLAVSPDGRLVATVNMRGTAFLPDSGRFQREATVSLLSFDPQSGHIAKLADYPFEGVLPEGGSFDLTGEHFMATVFNGHEGADAALGAGLEVFRVVRGETPALERVGRVPLPHGTHHVDLSP